MVVKAFVSSRLTPALNDDEYKALFRSLEAYHDEANELINWRSILSASVDREVTCIKGIFPRIVSDLLH